MYLVNSPEATDFMVGMGTETRRKVALGDKTKFQGTAAFNLISSAHNAVADGLPKIAALAQDPTRTDADKHHAARRVVNGICGVIAQSKAGLETEARDLAKEGGRIVDSALVLDPSRQFIHGRIADWIERQAKQPDGIKQIREATKTHSEVAALIYHLPHFLTGLSEETRGQIVLDGFERFASDGWNMIQHGQELKALAGKYAKFAGMLPVYAYNPELAKQGDRRVEI